MDPLVFSYDPLPIPSESKSAEIAKFNADQARWDEKHKNDPLSTKLLHISVVVLVVVIAFLIFFKLCWDAEKFSRRNPELVKEQRDRRNSIGKAQLYGVRSESGEDREQLYTTSKILPDFNPAGRRGSASGSKLQSCSSTPACFCILPSSGGKPARQKGWNRNKDLEPYGAQNV